MKPRSRIHVKVEPLSEARWRDVDEALFDALDASVAPPVRRPPVRAFALAGGVALAAAAAIALLARRPAPPPIAVAPPMPSHIETGPTRSFVALGFASLDVAPASAVTTTGDDARGV